LQQLRVASVFVRKCAEEPASLPFRVSLPLPITDCQEPRPIYPYLAVGNLLHAEPRMAVESLFGGILRDLLTAQTMRSEPLATGHMPSQRAACVPMYPSARRKHPDLGVCQASRGLSFRQKIRL